MKNRPIYLDYNATTPVDPQVLEAMLPFFNEKFGNASSAQHLYGWEAEEAVELAREQVASLIGAKASEIIFTSGATEAINLALKGILASNTDGHLITCQTEHKAVLDTSQDLQKKGHDITFLEVDEQGLIDLDQLTSSIREDTLLISIMLGNNETGVIQPIKQIHKIATEKGIPLFTDATQSVGKIAVDVQDLGVDLMAFSSHKMYGPKGIGCLYMKSNSNLDLKPQIVGGGHERGFRSGTLNVPGIVGFGKACELANKSLKSEIQRISILRNQLEKKLKEIGSIRINSREASRLPNVTNVSFEDINGSQLIPVLKGLAVSQGSACNSAVVEPSHVLQAMGISRELALSSLRISMGRFTTEDEIKKASEIIKSAVGKLRLQVS